MRIFLPLTLLAILLLAACSNDEKKLEKLITDINALHQVADSMETNIRTDMRTINSQISEMVDLGVDLELLGSFVDAYKAKERKFKKCTTQWDEITNMVISADPRITIQGDYDDIRNNAGAINDSLQMLSGQMAAIHSQAMGIIQQAREKDPASQPLE